MMKLLPLPRRRVSAKIDPELVESWREKINKEPDYTQRRETLLARLDALSRQQPAPGTGAPVRAVLETLSPDCVRALTAYYCKGMSREEVCSTYGISEETFQSVRREARDAVVGRIRKAASVEIATKSRIRVDAA